MGSLPFQAQMNIVPGFVVQFGLAADPRVQVEPGTAESLEKAPQFDVVILDNTPVKSVPPGRYLLINRRYETLFHVRRDTVLGRTDYDIFPKLMADAFRANDERALKLTGALTIEEIAPQDDGLHTYVSVKFPLTDAAGQPYGVCGISTDITERKRAEEALQESQRKYQALTETTSDFIWETDAQGRYTYCTCIYRWR